MKESNNTDFNISGDNPDSNPIPQADDENFLNDVPIWQAEEKMEQSFQEKKLKKIVYVLLIVGICASVCLVFFFYTLFDFKNSRNIPKISGAQQLGATDSSVLISWNNSDIADGYRVRLKDSDGGEIVSDYDIPFAALRSLQPNKNYSVDIFALKNGSEYGAQNITCSTESYCEVTKVKVVKVGSDFVNVSWEYNGVNQGFEAIAYVLDSEGKRHITSQKVKVTANKKPQCKISGLTSELNYTVAVMPLTSYCKIGKSVFKTTKNSKTYNKFSIIRFVIFSASAKNTVQVQDLKRIKPSSKYKTSLIINGKTDKNHKVNMSLLITDINGNLISEKQCGEVYTNPEGKQWYYHRSYIFDFMTPDKLGDYYIYLVVDGQTVDKIKFSVEY